MNTGYPALLPLMVESDPVDESSEKLNRRRVSATVGAIVLTLGACIAMPVAMLRMPRMSLRPRPR